MPLAEKSQEQAVDDEPNFTIPPENEIVTNPKVMLSTEIAALTGKNHKDVMRDIRVIVEQMQGADLRFACESTSYKGSNSQEYKCYELDYEATMIVMTGYDVVARAKVIKRWQELETLAKLGEAPKVEPKIGSEEVNSVSARELYLDLGFDASNWAKWARINVAENMFFKLGIDFIELVPSTSSPNPAKEYAVSIEMAKHLAMMAKTQRAHDYRKCRHRHFSCVNPNKLYPYK